MKYKDLQPGDVIEREANRYGVPEGRAVVEFVSGTFEGGVGFRWSKLVHVYFTDQHSLVCLAHVDAKVISREL